MALETKDTRRQLIIDLNDDGSIAGAHWKVITQVMDGKVEVARKETFPAATPEEWARYLGEGNAKTLSDMKAAHLQIANEREDAKRREEAQKSAADELQAAHKVASEAKAAAIKAALDKVRAAVLEVAEAAAG